MKDIIIISNYFPPEIGAASNRIFQLSKDLSKQHKVTVICPFPNYPTGKIFDGYRYKFSVTETIGSVDVKRLWVFPSVSKNKFVRLFSMLSFSFSIVWFFMWHKIPKTVIVNSPPLLVAFTSLLFLNSKKHKLILNVSDLWPSAGIDLGAIKKGLAVKMLLKIEAYNYKKPHLLLGQSEEIITHIKTIVPNAKTFLYRNFPSFQAPLIKNTTPSESKKIRVVYAGLLGVAQGVLKLCKEIDFNPIELHIYGTGAEEDEINNFISKNPHLPITFHGSLKREALHQVLIDFDVTIIPLLHRIYGSVPSKIFEYARLGLPIIYFGGGEGEAIIKCNHLGWTAEAGNYNALNELLNEFKKEDFNVEFKRKIQSVSLKEFDPMLQLKNLSELI